MGSIQAQLMPASGGDTMWCSLYSIYESLSAEMKLRIRDVDIAHAPGPGFMELVIEPLGEEFKERFHTRYGTGSRHPLFREHYVTNRPLVYLAGGFMKEIVGWDKEEGRGLLRELMEIAEDPAHQIRWNWDVHDMAIWDERSTMHRVDTSHWPEPRRMRRCTVG